MSVQAKFFSGRATVDLASRIAAACGAQLGNVIIHEFSDGEFQPSFEETVRGQDVFIIQSTNPPVENLFEMLLMVDAAKRASAKSIIVVVPYFGLARQDRKDKPRVPIGAKMVANLITAAGADRIITMDLHADQIQGFFEFPVDHLYASTIFIPYIKNLGLSNLTMASPDMGGTKRANAYAKHLGCEVVVCYKQRKAANEIEKMFLIGEVQGKDVVLVDDMVDTAGTLTKAADIMMENGAKSVRACCTHGILSGQACERVQNSALEEMIITDTIPVHGLTDKIKVLTVADLFGDVIERLRSHESISSNFIV